jgi:tetratricopeptide (TPR) repeat protein
MKRIFLTAASLVLLLALAATAPATQGARTFMDGTEAYRNGDWPAAIAAFERLADAGTDSGKLFYNLGNAYLKNDDLGRALLWYERALKRIPDDPDLRFNYNYALTLTKDERGERESPLLRILFFWKYQLSPSTVRWIAIVFNAALWTALSVLVIRKKRLWRPSIILTAAATRDLQRHGRLQFCRGHPGPARGDSSRAGRRAIRLHRRRHPAVRPARRHPRAG